MVKCWSRNVNTGHSCNSLDDSYEACGLHSHLACEAGQDNSGETHLVMLFSELKLTLELKLKLFEVDLDFSGTGKLRMDGESEKLFMCAKYLYSRRPSARALSLRVQATVTPRLSMRVFLARNISRRSMRGFILAWQVVGAADEQIYHPKISL